VMLGVVPRADWPDNCGVDQYKKRQQMAVGRTFNEPCMLFLGGVRQQTAGGDEPFFPSYSITRQIRFIF
jgi:hypothetical protein